LQTLWSRMLLVVGKFQDIRDNVFNEYWDLTRFEFYCIQQDSILWPKLILSTQSKLCEIHLGGEQAPPLVCPPPRIVRQVCNKVFGLGDQTRCLLKTKRVWVVNRVITRDTFDDHTRAMPKNEEAITLAKELGFPWQTHTKVKYEWLNILAHDHLQGIESAREIPEAHEANADGTMELIDAGQKHYFIFGTTTATKQIQAIENYAKSLLSSDSNIEKLQLIVSINLFYGVSWFSDSIRYMIQEPDPLDSGWRMVVDHTFNPLITRKPHFIEQWLDVTLQM